MQVSISWLLELVNLNTSVEELVALLPLRTIGTKEVTDKFIELDMKGYNRADLLSMRGVALEIAAITGSELNFTESDKFCWEHNNLPEAKVKVASPALTPLYCIARIEGLKPSKSPQEWVSKLSDCGVRSINDVADITNLIMLEYGQPMHAFDAGQIKDETLVVRTAKSGEEITTLDGKVRKLETSDLLITDPEKAVGIAGVMGGKNSEITDSTETILLEAAIFDPGNLRATTQRLGLPSEASRRFNHGLTKKRLLQALDTAIKMYQGLGGKLAALSIVGNTSDKIQTITLRKEKVEALIGEPISEEQIKDYLEKLYFNPEETEPGVWSVTVPYFRLDIEIEADLIEEIARMYGYEKIKPQELKGELPAKIDQTLFNNIYDTKAALAKAGLTEVQTYSFFSTAVLNNLNLDKDKLIKIANPISAETEYMRNKLWPNLVEVVAKNLKQGYKEIAIFEIGKVYQPEEGKLPKETYKLSIALSNDAENTVQQLWPIFQSLALHLPGVSVNQQNSPSELFHPVRFGRLIRNGQKVGKIAEVHPRITNKFGIEKRVAILECYCYPN